MHQWKKPTGHGVAQWKNTHLQFHVGIEMHQVIECGLVVSLWSFGEQLLMMFNPIMNEFAALIVGIEGDQSGAVVSWQGFIAFATHPK